MRGQTSACQTWNRIFLPFDIAVEVVVTLFFQSHCFHFSGRFPRVHQNELFLSRPFGPLLLGAGGLDLITVMLTSEEEKKTMIRATRLFTIQLRKLKLNFRKAIRREALHFVPPRLRLRYGSSTLGQTAKGPQAQHGSGDHEEACRGAPRPT